MVLKTDTKLKIQVLASLLSVFKPTLCGIFNQKPNIHFSWIKNQYPKKQNAFVTDKPVKAVVSLERYSIIWLGKTKTAWYWYQ